MIWMVCGYDKQGEMVCFGEAEAHTASQAERTMLDGWSRDYPRLRTVIASPVNRPQKLYDTGSGCQDAEAVWISVHHHTGKQ